MKKAFIRMELAVMQWALRMYRRVKRIFVKPIQLDMMTVEQLIDSKEFREELQRQIDMECQHHDEMARQAFSSGLRLQRAPIARLREKELFDAEHIAELYKRLVCKQLEGFSSAEREYIKQVCMMAYWRVVQDFKKNQHN